MAKSIEKIFRDALVVAEADVPMEEAKTSQPDDVRTISEMTDHADPPSEIRLFDSETALVAQQDLGSVRPREIIFPFFPIRVTQSGGSEGDADEICSFTYIMFDLNGNVLQSSSVTPVAPKRVRPAKGKMVAPIPLSYANAFLDEDNVIQLWNPGEVPSVDPCPT